MVDFVDTFGVDGFPHIADLDTAIWARYGVTTQPAFVFIDDDGSHDVHVGALGEDGLRDRLDTLLDT